MPTNDSAKRIRQRKSLRWNKISRFVPHESAKTVIKMQIERRCFAETESQLQNRSLCRHRLNLACALLLTLFLFVSKYFSGCVKFGTRLNIVIHDKNAVLRSRLPPSTLRSHTSYRMKMLQSQRIAAVRRTWVHFTLPSSAGSDAQLIHMTRFFRMR